MNKLNFYNLANLGPFLRGNMEVKIDYHHST